MESKIYHLQSRESDSNRNKAWESELESNRKNGSKSESNYFASTLQPWLEALKKLIFWGPILGGSRESCPKNFLEKKLRLQLNNFAQKLNFDVLWFRRRRAYKI